MSTSVLFWILLIVFRVSQDQSKAEWVLFQEKCIQLHRILVSYSSAKSSCESQKTSLVSIKNQVEMDFIANLQRRANMWVGLSRKTQWKKWYWSDGREFVNVKWWKKDEPRETLFAYFRDGALLGKDDSFRSYYVCEKEATMDWKLIDRADYNFDDLCGVEIMPNCEGLPCQDVCKSHQGCDQFAKVPDMCVNIKNVSETDNCVVKLRPNLELRRLHMHCQ